MVYRKVYPSKKLRFSLKDNALNVYLSGKTQYNPDIWGIKYLFDRGLTAKLAKIYVNSAISNTVALRMFFSETFVSQYRVS